MKITYFTDRRIEVLSIKSDDGKPIRERAYYFGNCLIDLLYGHDIVENGSVVKIDERLNSRPRRCSNSATIICTTISRRSLKRTWRLSLRKSMRIRMYLSKTSCAACISSTLSPALSACF